MARILVVEDEFGIAEVLQSALTDAGHDVVLAINGKQGLERLKEVMPRHTWLPSYGALFHTEAALEFEEYKQERDVKGTDRRLLRSKLDYALEALQHAMKVSDSPLYNLLKESIKREQNHLARKHAKA